MDKNLIIENSINETNSAKASEESNKSTENDKKSKKIILSIIIGISILIIIIMAAILIVKLTIKNEEEQLEILGEIKCKYQIDTLNSIKLIGDDFIKLSNFDIYIDGTKIKYTKEYKFDNLGEHEIKFILYEDLYMD